MIEQIIANLPTFTLINGPPHSGKGTLAELLACASTKVVIDSFAQPIRDHLYVTFGFDGDLRDGPTKAQDFDYPDAQGHNKTCRHAMIDFSEKYMKVFYGNTIFGKLLYKRCLERIAIGDDVKFVIDDSGFDHEAWPLIDAKGADALLLIRLRRLGCDYSKDSRGYVSLPGVRTLDIINNGTKEELIEQLGYTKVSIV